MEVYDITKRVLLIVVSFTVLSTLTLWDPLPVFQPNETSYSAAESSALLPTLEQLGEVLSDVRLGPQRIFRPHDWNRLDFSAYTSGPLKEHGYTTRHVAADSWPDVVHTCVLIGTLFAEHTAWIPVEVTPNLGETHLTFGSIPTTISSIVTDSRRASDTTSALYRSQSPELRLTGTESEVWVARSPSMGETARDARW